MKQQMMGWQWHQLNHVQINCTSSQTDNSSMAASDHSIFYSPDALPDAQPTVSKHEGMCINILIQRCGYRYVQSL